MLSTSLEIARRNSSIAWNTPYSPKKPNPSTTEHYKRIFCYNVLVPRGIVKKDNLVKETLLALAVAGGVIILASLSPNFFSYVARDYFKEKDKRLIKARARRLRELQKRKLVIFKEVGGGKVRIELTKNGKLLVREYNLEDMKLKIPQKWDGRWRLITYDIPVRQRKASNAFREKIRQMGLFQLQRSIWVSPYECLEELEFLTSVFEIDMDNCILYFSTKDIPREMELKKYFDL